jgi:hypothetical protein
MVRVVSFSVSFYVFLCLEVQDKGKRKNAKWTPKQTKFAKARMQNPSILVWLNPLNSSGVPFGDEEEYVQG